jgi:hypothetical protein
MGGQIVDATLIAAPKQRNTQDEKDAIKAGKAAEEIWPDEPAKAAQKDVDARWTVKFAKARTAADGKAQIDIAIPSFGYKNHVAITSALALSVRPWSPTVRAKMDHNCAKWSRPTIQHLMCGPILHIVQRPMKPGLQVSRIHRKKPKGQPRSQALRAANRAKSKIRARVEHVFAQQKAHMGLFIRTIGIKRAQTKIMLANLVYNMQRLIFHERRLATG